MHKLSQAYTPPLLTLNDQTYHLFPKPDQLPVDLEEPLRLLGFGYRGAFLDASLRSLRAEFKDEIEKGLTSWRDQDANVVGEKLQNLKGVGRKVADCVMLMCLDQVGIFTRYTLMIAIRHPHRYACCSNRRPPSIISQPAEKQGHVEANLRRDASVSAGVVGASRRLGSSCHVCG